MEKAKGFVLQKIRYQDADLIIKVLTADQGVLSLFVKGALKSTKKYSGGIFDPTHFIEVGYRIGAHRTLCTVTEAKLLYDFSGLRTQYEKIELALYFLDKVGQVTLEQDPNLKNIFNLLGNALKQLESPEQLPDIVFKLRFLEKLLFYLGISEGGQGEEGLHKMSHLSSQLYLRRLEHLYSEYIG
jgi:DNA repair protein RecO (recombination protein O)